MMAENSLIEVQPKDAFTVFTTENALDPILAQVRTRIDDFDADVSTASGRKAIKSMAYKVAQSKSYLEGVGKDLAAEAKSVPNKIDAARKHARDTLDEWRDEVRAPLTEWEEAEEARTEKHLAAIKHISSLSELIDGDGQPWPSSVLRERLDALDHYTFSDEYEEFLEEYQIASKAAIAILSDAVVKKEKQEADERELAELRKAQAERKARETAEREERAAKERDEALKREAAERATAEAEAKAQAEIQAKEDAARTEREAAERREQELQQKLEDVKRRAAEAKETAEREVAESKEREDAESAAREADKEHRRTVNVAAVDALIAGGIPKSHAIAAVTLIAQHAVPRVRIEY